jgi:hypothetical protein
LLSQLKGASVFSKIDFLSRYHTLTVQKENAPKSAIWTWYDHYEVLVMPFGLTYTQLVFMDLMNQAFHEYLHSVGSAWEKKFFAKLVRCEFRFEEVSFLVHVMNKNGLVANSLKQELKTTPVLKLPMEIVGIWFAQICHDRVGMRPWAARLGCGICFWTTVDHEEHSLTHDLEFAMVDYALAETVRTTSMVKCVKTALFA